MDLRVTLQTTVNRALDETRRQTDTLAQLQVQASTGKRLQAPSDDPALAAVLQEGSVQTDRLQSYLDNINALKPSLDQSVSTLQDVSGIFIEARSVALQASQSTNDAQSNNALANQVDQLLSRLISDANTQSNGDYIYSGSATQTKPFAITSTDAQGNPLQVTYQGAADHTQAIVSLNQTVSPYLSGKEVFQTPGTYDAFQTLMALRDTLRNTSLSSHDQALAASALVGEIDRVNGSVQNATGQQSAVLQSLNQLQNHVQDLRLSTQRLVSDLGDADLSQVVVQMQAQQNLLQLSLYGFSRILQQSLLDFIK